MTRRFPTLFWRQVVRHMGWHPLLACLNILSIALGITVFLAIQLANRGALGSFRAAAELTTGRAQLEIRGDLPEALLPLAQKTPGVRAATPLVEGIVTLPDRPGEYLRILGVDPFTGNDVFAFHLDEAGSHNLSLDRWLADPEAIAVPDNSIVQGPVRVLAGNALHELKPSYVLRGRDPQGISDRHFAAMDIGWAQELLGQAGHLSSIQILLEKPADLPIVQERLRQLVPTDATVAPPAARGQEMEKMLSAFQLNLSALSVVSIFVGMFLISNSVNAAIVRRRREVAILRASGATRGEIRLLFVGEAALHALAGSLLGLGAAPLLAEWLAAPIARNVSSLYAIVSITAPHLSAGQIGEALAVGLLAAILAAWLPASAAAAAAPAEILHPGAGVERLSPIRRFGLPAAVLALTLAALCGVAALHGGPPYLGFASAALVLAGFSFLAPWFAAAAAHLLRRCDILSRIAADHLRRSLGRQSLTVAALAAAIAMMISVTVMIHSFRASVARWVSQTLVADLYLAPAANDLGGPQAFLPAMALDWARSNPEVAETSSFREVPILFRNEPTTLGVTDGRARGDLEFVDGAPASAFGDFQAGRAVAVSESFASRFHLGRGDRLSLATPSGRHDFPVCGVFRDFTRDRGIILMRRSLFDPLWRDPRIHSLALKLRNPRQADSVGEAFRQKFGREGGEFVTYDNAALRRRVFEIFDQTFAVTTLLRLIAIAIAVAGVVFSLSVLVIEREREIGVLRSLGASRGQVLGIFLWEALLIGLAACAAGIASGSVLAMVLTWVINQAFFGWTIALSYPVFPLAATPAWFLPAALAAALWPAWRALRVAPARAVRFE